MYMCLCVCLFVSIVFMCSVCVLKRLIHTCACGDPSADSVWREGEERDRGGAPGGSGV